VFAAESVLSVTNQHSLPRSVVYSKIGFTAEICCQQRTSVRCQKCVICSESTFAIESSIVYSEIGIAAEIMMSAANQSSLSKLCCVQ
jgi:hypothetical protein